MNANLIIGVVAILIGLFQFYSVHKSWKTLRVSMNSHSSLFMPFAIWYSIFFGLIFIGLGISALLA
ncbi:hypothetical protein [Pediococcus ethanolidurans]|nr:hypothetical protein [Pediococcus ethanolidurans]MCT4398691.1 hypothetical protein [Pediococcus ethanolidurans]MCV3321555.1 hypothetical protein [Pediococcus ethanolidurans]MCV3323775.1 hypothetical protein [Pediococcus ethanolidurans]SER76853.1 hypothetical protein SAMN04487973_11617 [Pediococcus ethanolidurans]GEN95631.1 hypothetical protein PET01_16810 [Pediococcus ethanolidurans]